MLLDDISAYLDTTYTSPVTPVLTAGTNLFLSRIQDSPDFCVALYESPIGPGEYTLGGGIRVYEESNLQVIVRDSEFKYSSARIFMERIINLLDAINNNTLSGTRYIRIKVIGTPIPLPADSRDRVLISVNFHVIKDPTVVASP